MQTAKYNWIMMHSWWKLLFYFYLTIWSLESELKENFCWVNKNNSLWLKKKKKKKYSDICMCRIFLTMQRRWHQDRPFCLWKKWQESPVKIQASFQLPLLGNRTPGQLTVQDQMDTTHMCNINDGTETKPVQESICQDRNWETLWTYFLSAIPQEVTSCFRFVIFFFKEPIPWVSTHYSSDKHLHVDE